MALALTLLFGLFVVGLLIHAGLLWLSARLFRAIPASRRRLWLTCLGVPLLAVLFNVPMVASQLWHPLAPLGVLALMIVVVFALIGKGLQVSAGKAIGIGVTWLVLGTAAGLGFAFLVFKPYVAEAFVNPTGGMAETLLGYHKEAVCPQCGYRFPVSASEEAMHQVPVLEATCPNCLDEVRFSSPEAAPVQTGDRFLVVKLGAGAPERLQVMTFRYPVGVQDQKEPLNYIKRLVGLPGETIAIHGGQLYVYDQPRANPPPPPKHPETGQPMYWSHEYPPGRPEICNQFEWPDDVEARQLFEAGQFTIIRKSPEQMLALRRSVHDNDHQARDRIEPALARWQAEGSWKPDNTSFSHAGGDGLDWLRYRHLLRGRDDPQLITDILGYNRTSGSHWVGDLMLECDVQMDQPQGELILELRRAADRFQARFDLAAGQCQLFRLPKDGGEQALGEAATPVKGPGAYHLVFANFDERLTLWVSDELPFGDGVPYTLRRENGPDNGNDLQPAGIGIRGAGLSVSHLKLWRDIYYTTSAGDLQTHYIYPGHYLLLGDNSIASADSRYWGLAPADHLMGPAVLIYWPRQRFGPIR